MNISDLLYDHYEITDLSLRSVITISIQLFFFFFGTPFSVSVILFHSLHFRSTFILTSGEGRKKQFLYGVMVIAVVIAYIF